MDTATNTQDAQELQEKDFSATYTILPGCQLELTLTVQPSASKHARQSAIRSVNKETSLPGFRKGKAPEKIILKQFGPHVESQWQEELFRVVFGKFVDSTQLHPITRSLEPKIKNLSLEEDSLMTLSYEYYPIIPEIDPKKLSLPEEKNTVVSEEDIQSQLEDYQRIHQEWKDVEGRAIEENDFIEVSVNNIDQEPPLLIAGSRLYKVNKDKMANWMLPIVLGKNTGDLVEGKATFSEDEQKKDQGEVLKEGVNYRIEIKKILNLVRPEINDDLAKKLDLETVEELKEKAREDFSKHSESENKRILVETLIDEVVSKFPFEIPTSVYEDVRQDQTKSEIEKLKKRGLSDKQIEEQQEDIETRVKHDASKEIHWHYIAQHIAQEQKFQISKEELNQALSTELYLSGLIYQQQHPQFQQQLAALQRRVESMLMVSNAADYLIAKNRENS
jgi:trigger factor